MEIEFNTVERKGEEDCLNAEIKEILENGTKSLQEVKEVYLNNEILKDLNDTLQSRLKLLKSELNSKEANLKFQKSYIKTQQSNQAKLEKLSIHCDDLQKTLQTLNLKKSDLIQQKTIEFKKLEEKKVFFYSTLKKEQNSKTLLNSIQSKINTLSLQKAQIINSIRDDQLQSIDHRITITKQHLASNKTQEPISTSKPAPIIPLTVILFLILILNLIY